MAFLITLCILMLLAIPVSIVMAFTADSLKWLDWLVEIVVVEFLVAAVSGGTAFAMWI